MLKYIFIVLFVCLSFLSKSQEIQPIQTDRPDQTESPSITPKHQLQMEIGFVYEQENIITRNFTHANVLTKFGLSDRVELRLVTDYGTTQYSFNNSESSSSYFNPTLIGCKVAFFDEKGLRPKTSMILHLGLPFLASKSFKFDQVFTTYRFLMQHTLNDKMSLSYNLGAEWDGVTAQPAGIYTLAMGYGISSRIGSYIELYGSLQGRVATHQYDMGFTYLISSDIQLDLSGGVGITKNAPDYFVGCGISFRTGH
jgi:Putative MetA-pathway of phenol degradation